MPETSINAIILQTNEISMNNFSTSQASNMDFNNEAGTKDCKHSKLYVAYINRPLIAFCEINNQYSEFDEWGFDNHIPLVISAEEEAMLYDKYY